MNYTKKQLELANADAQVMLKNCRKWHLNYARKTNAYGDRGFCALHDVMDANCLLLAALGDKDYKPASVRCNERIDRMVEVFDSIVLGEKPIKVTRL